MTPEEAAQFLATALNAVRNADLSVDLKNCDGQLAIWKWDGERLASAEVYQDQGTHKWEVSA